MRGLCTLIAVLVLTAAGCASSGPGHVPVGPAEDSLPGPMRESGGDGTREEEAWEALRPEDATRGTIFHGAAEAPPCPQIAVAEDPAADPKEMMPSRRGMITVVIVVPINMPSGQALLKHVNDLVRHYSAYKVTGRCIVARTPNHQYAARFAREMKITLPIYWDDLKMRALRRLADAAGAEHEQAMPATFIIDRNQKVRFYRPGFRGRRAIKYQGDSYKAVGGPVIHEDVEEEESIETYLRKILRENW